MGKNIKVVKVIFEDEQYGREYVFAYLKRNKDDVPHESLYVVCRTRYGRQIGVITDLEVSNAEYLKALSCGLKPCSYARAKDLYKAGYVYEHNTWYLEY